MKTTSKILFVLLIFLFLILTITSMKDNSYTDVEPIHIFQGYSILVNGYAFQAGDPSLIGIIGAIPLLFMDVDFPPLEEVYHAQRYARNDFFYYSNNNVDRMIFASRMMIVFLSLIFAVYLFKWAKDLYGINAGLFALFLYVLNPDIIINSTLVTGDLPVAGFLLICLYYYWKLNTNQEKQFKNLLLSGIFFGLAMATKSTAIFIIPLFFILPFLYKKKIKFAVSRASLLLIIAILSFSIVGLRDISELYSDDTPFYQVGQSKEFRSEDRLDTLIPSIIKNEFLQNSVKYTLTKIPFPNSNSLQAYLVQILHTRLGHPQYFIGKFTMHGVWYFYFVAYLIKTPIALIILFISSFLLFKKYKHKMIENEYYLLLIMAFILFIVSFLMKLNLGLRHILLVHLLGFIFISKISQLLNKNNIIKLLIILLIVWYAIASFSIYPYYMSYFNEFIGGPNNGHKYLVDASLDSGQYLKLLGTYVKEHNFTQIQLRFAGFEDPSYRGINYTELECNKPTDGIIVVSASSLKGFLYYDDKTLTPDPNCFKWLNNFEPIDKIGYSIFIYNITEEQLRPKYEPLFII